MRYSSGVGTDGPIRNVGKKFNVNPFDVLPTTGGLEVSVRGFEDKNL